MHIVLYQDWRISASAREDLGLMLHLKLSGWLQCEHQWGKGDQKRVTNCYLIKESVYLTSGVTSTPPSTTFDTRNTANAEAIASHIVASAN